MEPNKAEPDNDPEYSRLLREKMDMHKAPDQLRRKIMASIEQQRQPSLLMRLGSLAQSVFGQWRQLSAAAACGVLVTLMGTQLMTAARTDDRMLQQLTSSHVRALVVNHSIDVVSSDRHTVKPWFAGKLDYSPKVRDYVTDGFELAGGRLDYVNDRVVAALVYKRRLHSIDVYTWPTTEANSAVEIQARKGINLAEWADGGMKYYAVSDIDRAELAELARLMRTPRGD
jgi:anti-sigma factor RsiW